MILPNIKKEQILGMNYSRMNWLNNQDNNIMIYFSFQILGEEEEIRVWDKKPGKIILDQIINTKSYGFS